MTVHQHPRLAAYQAALGLASRGFHVFPCRGSNKRPCTPHGFHDAVTGAIEATALFKKYPGELVGMPTGPVNNFDVLDVDPDKGGSVWEKENQHRLPRTFTYQTRSGGRHYRFLHHPGIRNSESKIAPGVDVRGEGGYVIAWFAHGRELICDANPAPWPAWLLEKLLPKSTPATEPPRWKARVATDDTSARRLIQYHLRRLSQAKPGERHYLLRNCALVCGGLLNADPNISRSQIAAELYAVIKSVGGDDINKENAQATIAWGLDEGAKKPLRVRETNG